MLRGEILACSSVFGEEAEHQAGHEVVHVSPALALTPVMRELLERRCAGLQSQEELFTGVAAGHLSKMAARVGSPAFMVHDLRKLVATAGERLGPGWPPRFPHLWPPWTPPPEPARSGQVTRPQDEPVDGPFGVRDLPTSPRCSPSA